MWKRISWIFPAFSAVFFLFVIGLTGYRIETVREGNARKGGPATAVWTERILALGAETGGFQTPAFARSLREEAARQPRFLLLCLRSPEGEILYITSRDQSYLKRPARVTADWRGTPSYAVRPGFHEVFAYPFQSAGKTLILDALYLILAREDLYPILRDDLFLFLSFLLLCGITLLLVSSYPQPSRPDGNQSSKHFGRGSGEAPSRGKAMGTPRRGVPAAAPAAERDDVLDELPDMVVAVQPAPTPAAPDAVPDASPATARAVAPDAVPDASPEPCPEPEEKTFFSPASGLVWREYFMPRLRSEIERAAAFDMDLSLCFVKIDTPPSEGGREEVLAAFSGMLRSCFPLRDLLFEAGDDSFSVILPDTDIDQAVAVLENLRGKLEALEIAGSGYTASLGASSRGGRLIDEKSLLEETEAALHKAVSDGGNQVVGFRADPMRFRETLSAIGS